MKTNMPTERRKFLMQSGGLLLIASGVFSGCGGGSNDTRSEPYEIPLVGNHPTVSNQSASVSTGGGKVELPGVAAIVVPTATFSSATPIRIQATQDPYLALIFQITGSAALPTHRSAYEVRIGLRNELPKDKFVTAWLAIPDALLGASSGAVAAFVRYYDPNPEDVVESFDPIEATVDYTAKTVAINLWPAHFSQMPDGSNEAQVILALVPIGRSQHSRKPGSRPAQTDPDWCDEFTVHNLSSTIFKSPPLNVPLFITSRIGCREATNDLNRKPHKGVDLRAQTPVPILAVADGYVEKVVYFSQSPTTLGNFVRIRHLDGTAAEYLHLSDFGTKLKSLVNNKIYAGPIGAVRVTAGEQLGLTGSTSTVAGLAPHLHFQLRLGPGDIAAYINPEPHLIGAMHDQPGLISEFLFRVDGQDYVTSDALLPVSLEAGKSVTLALKAKDSVFRDVALPADGGLTATVAPEGMATAAISGGSVVITGVSGGEATVKVEYHQSTQDVPKPKPPLPPKVKAFGNVRLKVQSAPTPEPTPTPTPDPTPTPTPKTTVLEGKFNATIHVTPDSNGIGATGDRVLKSESYKVDGDLSGSIYATPYSEYKSDLTGRDVRREERGQGILRLRLDTEGNGCSIEVSLGYEWKNLEHGSGVILAQGTAGYAYSIRGTFEKTVDRLTYSANGPVPPGLAGVATADISGSLTVV